MRRVAVFFILLAAAVGVTFGLIVGIAHFKEGVSINQMAEIFGLIKPQPTILSEQQTVRDYVNRIPHQNFAGVKINEQNASQVEIFGTLIELDQSNSTARIDPQVPDYIRRALVEKYGVMPLEKRETIGIYLQPTTQFLDPYVSRERTYKEMLDSQDGNLAKMVGLYIHITAAGRPDKTLEARRVVVAGVSL